MNWSTWQPRERATLCFIVEHGRVLLIRKRRGFGAGKINAPGGKLEPGETPLQAAIRETEEEICATPLQLTESGTLHFQFTDGYSLHCTVFRAEGLLGEPQATAEADPFWCALKAVPYAEMWEDDRHWLPLLFARSAFAGYFTFDGDTMLTRQVDLLATPPGR